VASAEGWTLNSSGSLVQVPLTGDQWSQAASQAQSINSDPTALNSALDSIGVNASGQDTFMVPQVDSTGAVVGFSAETPISATSQGDGVTQYTFPGGVIHIAGR
jgi:hypothetical protein